MFKRTHLLGGLTESTNDKGLRLLTNGAYMSKQENPEANKAETLADLELTTEQADETKGGVLLGGAGRDVLLGGAGDDILIGGDTAHR